MDEDTDTGPDTPGTDQSEIDEDARLLGNEPDPEAIDEPTQDSQQEAQETYWMLKETLAIGLFSVLAVVLLAFGLMQATGLITLPEPIGNSALAQVAVFVLLGAVLVGALLWSQRGT